MATVLALALVPVQGSAATIEFLSSESATIGNASTGEAGAGLSVYLAGDDPFSSATATADFRVSEIGGFGIALSGYALTSCGTSLVDCPTINGASLVLIRLDPDPLVLLDATPTVGNDSWGSSGEPFDVATYRMVIHLSQLGGGDWFRFSGSIHTFPIPESSSLVLYPLGLAVCLVGWICSDRARA
jgi:hypothetical protein